MAMKYVDSTKLDAGMTATADAIRVKTGDDAALTWDYAGGTGFASAVAAITGGGGGGGGGGDGRCPRASKTSTFPLGSIAMTWPVTAREKTE